MKICTKCKLAKPTGDFFVRDKRTGRLHAQCKACHKEYRTTYSKLHYQKYGDLYRLRAKRRRAAIKSTLQQEMIAYLSDKACETCGENDPRVLDFDHIDPTIKSFGIARAITNGLNWSAILEEINKCRILCANCHRKRTAAQQGWYR